MALTISDVYDALSAKVGKSEAKIVADYLEEKYVCSDSCNDIGTICYHYF